MSFSSTWLSAHRGQGSSWVHVYTHTVLNKVPFRYPGNIARIQPICSQHHEVMGRYLHENHLSVISRCWVLCTLPAFEIYLLSISPPRVSHYDASPKFLLVTTCNATWLAQHEHISPREWRAGRLFSPHCGFKRSYKKYMLEVSSEPPS